MKAVLRKQLFHTVGPFYKPKKQSELLNSLGISLQKGEVQENQTEEPSQNNNDGEHGDKINGIKDNYKKLQDYYNSISHMSIED